MKKYLIGYIIGLLSFLIVMIVVDSCTGIYNTPDKPIPNAASENWQNVP